MSLMSWFLSILAVIFLALAVDLWRLSRGTGARSQPQEDREAFGIENLPVSDAQRRFAIMNFMLPSRSAASVHVLAATLAVVAVVAVVAVALVLAALTLQ